MRPALLLPLAALLALASPLPAANASAAAPAPGPAACDAAPAPAPEACGGAGPLCPAAERARIACELRQAIEARYVFLTTKPFTLAAAGRPGFDPRAHLEACVEGERAVAVERDPLRFYDRMRRCVAGFEDGHLLLRVPSGAPQVALGIGLRLAADGRVYVASRSPALGQALARAGIEDPGALLAPGTRVLAIDGRPVRAAMDALAALLPGSSAAARAERAVDALTRRDFLHPARATAELTVIARGARRTVRLPWWASPGAARGALGRALLARTGIRTADLGEAGAALVDGGDPSGGVRRTDSIFAPDEAATLRTYTGDGGGPAARLGEVTGPGGRTVCYAQLLSLHTEALSAGGERRPFTDVLGEFVRGCDARGADLVLDLRQNGGGYLSHSTALARMLLPAGASSPGGALVLRATEFNEGVYRERAPMLGGAPAVGVRSRSEPERVLESIRGARKAGDDFTPALLEPPLRPDPAEGGFRGRVVALTSPACMSACERLAGLLRSGGRAVLVGGPTEGAGGSQQEAKGLAARWTDSRGRLSVSIPNAAMGVQPSGGAGEEASADEFFAALALENRPVEPHRRYATTRADLVDHGRGWREQAWAALGGDRPLRDP